jgi:hypothetical protein
MSRQFLTANYGTVKDKVYTALAFILNKKSANDFISDLEVGWESADFAMCDSIRNDELLPVLDPDIDTKLINKSKEAKASADDVIRYLRLAGSAELDEHLAEYLELVKKYMFNIHFLILDLVHDKEVMAAVPGIDDFFNKAADLIKDVNDEIDRVTRQELQK